MSSQVKYQSQDFTTSLPAQDFEECTFINCNFSQSDLSKVSFTECSFTNCDLSMCNLNNTQFSDCVFQECRMLGLKFEQCNKFLLSYEFKGCDLSFASFYQLKMNKTRFATCKLHEVDFVETQLENSTFENCDFDKAVFERTNLKGADLITSINYSIDPTLNQIKGAKFSLPEVVGLLVGYGIKIVDS